MSRELYEKQTWANLPDESTPISAERLAHLEEGIYQNSEDKALKELYGDNHISLGRKANTTAGNNSIATGYDAEASGSYSCAEGYGTSATNMAAHTEGYGTVASGHSAHAEGMRTKAERDFSHAEGNETVSSGGFGSHSEGNSTKASGQASHAEGTSTVSSGNSSHAEGMSCVASSVGCHAEGNQTTAKGTFAHVEGCYTKASSDYQHVQGKYNVEDTENKYAHIVGNGTADNARSNAHTIDWEGNAWFAGDVANGNGVSLDGLKTRIDEMETGGTSGTTDYTELKNKPQINGVELLGNKTTSDLGITAESVGADAAGSASTALSDAKEYTNAKIDDLVNGAPSTLDTLKEISEALAESGEAVEAINQAIGNKLDKSGDSKDNTATFTQANERSNITSNEKHSTIFGKIAKWFSDLKTVAFSGSYNDLSNKPNIPTKVSELENDSGYATDEELKKTTELAALNKQTLGYGKKNLLKNTATTYTTNGVTYTVNNDGSVTANGTATADASINLSDFSLTNPSNSHVETLKSGNYILSGISGGSDVTYFIQYRDMTKSLSQNATDGDKEITVVNGNNVYVVIRVKAGITANNLTFYPMIRSADIEDGTYEPYVDDVDTRIESLTSSVGKMVSSALNGKQFVTLQAFVEATASDITHGHMFRFKDTGGWGPTGKTSDWYRCIVDYQNPYNDANTYTVGGRVIITNGDGTNVKNWLGTISGTKSTGVSVKWERNITDKHTLNTLEEITANTKPEMITGALATKQIINNMGGLRFGVDKDGNYGYYKDGADTVTPFKSGGFPPITKIELASNSLLRTTAINIYFDATDYNSLSISGECALTSANSAVRVCNSSSGELFYASGGSFEETIDISGYDLIYIGMPAEYLSTALISSIEFK